MENIEKIKEAIKECEKHLKFVDKEIPRLEEKMASITALQKLIDYFKNFREDILWYRGKLKKDEQDVDNEYRVD